MTITMNRRNYDKFTTLNNEDVWINKMMIVSIIRIASGGSRIQTFDGGTYQVKESIDEVLKKID